MNRVLPNTPVGPPTYREDLEIAFSGTLKGRLATRVAEEAARRRVEPAELAADMLEIAIRDDLFAAILD